MVKTILVILGVISSLILVGFFLLGHMSKTGEPPGLVSGHLSACSVKPNCVVSEIAEDDSHYISPLHYPAAMAENTMALITQIIQEVGGEITVEDEGYIAALFTSDFFGFVDDLECRNDKANHTLHLRSASRVGHSDFGANRQRVELISSLFHQRVKKASQAMPLTNTKPLSHS